MLPWYVQKLLHSVRHGPRTAVPRTARDVTDMFFGPIRSSWKFVKGAYRYVTARQRPKHKNKRAFSFNASAYKKNRGALSKVKR